MKKSIAFTLAETMIALTVIGVLAAILLPSAKNLTANEDVMKFKKAHNALNIIIQELVSSDEYYLDGMLGYYTNGNYVEDPLWFCKTIADLSNPKKVNCTAYGSTGGMFTEEDAFSAFDIWCKQVQQQNTAVPQITLSDDTIFYETSSNLCFGCKWSGGTQGRPFFDYVGTDPFYDQHKPFCIDIDGWKKGEDPFGYGIRIDGKISYGLRAQEWLEKSFSEND